jgi:hypothetical protein
MTLRGGDGGTLKDYLLLFSNQTILLSFPIVFFSPYLSRPLLPPMAAKADGSRCRAI